MVTFIPIVLNLQSNLQMRVYINLQPMTHQGVGSLTLRLGFAFQGFVRFSSPDLLGPYTWVVRAYVPRD